MGLGSSLLSCLHEFGNDGDNENSESEGCGDDEDQNECQNGSKNCNRDGDHSGKFLVEESCVRDLTEGRAKNQEFYSLFCINYFDRASIITPIPMQPWKMTLLQ